LKLFVFAQMPQDELLNIEWGMIAGCEKMGHFFKPGGELLSCPSLISGD
jgi:hypothetical protein